MERQPEISSSLTDPATFGHARGVELGARVWHRALEHLLMGEVSTLRLAIIAGLPVLILAWLMLAPERMLSREMTWDLMFNLSGAWHLHTGQIAHVDYRDPLGFLAFRLTQLGYLIVGPSPRAFLVGQTIFLIPVFAASVFAAARRLALLPALVFVVHTALLVLMPANVGDQMNAYTFAVWYNRWGWSILTTLLLFLVFPPRPGRAATWLDVVTCGLLLIVLFYVKIPIALAGLGATAFALVAANHIRAEWRRWAIAPAMMLVNAAAPYNYAYWSDIWFGVTSGYARAVPIAQVSLFVDNKAEYSLYLSGLILLVWLWLRGRATFQSIVLAVGTLAIGMFALSQNYQERFIPLGILIAYLVYDALSGKLREIHTGRAPEALLPLAAVMVWPVLGVLGPAMTVAGYHRAAQREGTHFEVQATNLRGLVVPVETHEVAETLATVHLPYTLLSDPRQPPLIFQLTQQKYVESLLEAASLFASGERGQPRIWVVDVANPLPFMLGYPPPRGVSLWMRQGQRLLPAAEVLADVEVVLIPKFSTYAQVTSAALAAYQDYLLAEFPIQEQTPSWTVFSRKATRAVQ
jgi:hypothetical protein